MKLSKSQTKLVSEAILERAYVPPVKKAMSKLLSEAINDNKARELRNVIFESAEAAFPAAYDLKKQIITNIFEKLQINKVIDRSFSTLDDIITEVNHDDESKEAFEKLKDAMQTECENYAKVVANYIVEIETTTDPTDY